MRLELGKVLNNVCTKQMYYLRILRITAYDARINMLSALVRQQKKKKKKKLSLIDLVLENIGTKFSTFA